MARSDVGDGYGEDTDTINSSSAVEESMRTEFRQEDEEAT
jgi:hypothetical protein